MKLIKCSFIPVIIYIYFYVLCISRCQYLLVTICFVSLKVLPSAYALYLLEQSVLLHVNYFYSLLSNLFEALFDWKNVDSRRATLQSILPWWCNSYAQNADWWCCRVRGWHPSNWSSGTVYWKFNITYITCCHHLYYHLRPLPWKRVPFCPYGRSDQILRQHVNLMSAFYVSLPSSLLGVMQSLCHKVCKTSWQVDRPSFIGCTILSSWCQRVSRPTFVLTRKIKVPRHLAKSRATTLSETMKNWKAKSKGTVDHVRILLGEILWLIFRFIVNVDGEGCGFIFIMGCWAWDGRAQTGKR